MATNRFAILTLFTVFAAAALAQRAAPAPSSTQTQMEKMQAQINELQTIVKQQQQAIADLQQRLAAQDKEQAALKDHFAHHTHRFPAYSVTTVEAKEAVRATTNTYRFVVTEEEVDSPRQMTSSPPE